MQHDFQKVAQGYMGRVGGVQVVRQAQQAAVGRPAVQVPAGSGAPVGYAPDAYIAAGDTYFGLGRTTVPANDDVTVQKNPVRPFDPIEFRCVSSQQELQVVQVDIEGTLYFANKNAPGEGMPIELFSEVSLMGGLNWSTIQTDTGVSVTVRNDTGVDRVFASGFRGMQLRR